MRIARIELHGFKSFPDRTSFELGRGVCCVVGPNGCGKSNVVDAIKWCIGEQSAKSLRGSDMIDVIFAGSAERSPVSIAEVAITFSADQGDPFPGEYSNFAELQVARKLHRTGQGEYFINQVRVRRRDLINLFLDTGIGSNLYSFIEQGRVDKIVNASPEERRLLIDEAAGISRYKVRRDESQERLVAAAAQLDRASDVSDEMGRRIQVLERQVIQSATFRTLRARIRQGEIALALVKYAGLSADRRLLRDRVRALRGQDEELGREIGRREVEIGRRRDELAVSEVMLGTLRDEVAELDAQRRELDSVRSQEERRVAELADRVRSLDDELEKARSAVEDAGVALATAIQERDVAQAELGRIESSRGEVGALVERLREEEASRSEAVRSLEGRRRSAEAERGAIAGRLGSLTGRRGELPGRVQAAEARLGEAIAEEGRCRSALAVASEAEAAAKAELAAAEGLAAKARAGAKAVEAELAGLKKTLAEAEKKSLAAREAWNAALRGRSEGELTLGRSIDEAVRKAESAVRSRTDQARADHQRRTESDWTWLRQELGVGEQRAQTWRTAARSRDEAALDGLRSRLDREREAVVDGIRGRALALEREASQRAQEVERGALSEVRAAIDEIQRRREGHLVEKRAAEGRIEASDRRGAQARAQRIQAEARVEALIQAEEASRKASKGSAALAAALAKKPRVADRLSDAEVVRAKANPWLGDRLVLPVVGEVGEVRRLLEEFGAGGEGAFVWQRGEDLLGQLLGGAQVAGTVDEGLSKSGVEAVVIGEGIRIEADGVVRIGKASREAADALARRAERTELAAKIEETRAAERAAGDERASIVAEVAALVEKIAQCQSESSRVEAEGTAKAREEAERERSRVVEEVRLLRVRLEEEQKLGSQRRDEQVRALGEAQRGESERIEAWGREAVAALRVDLEAEVRRRIVAREAALQDLLRNGEDEVQAARAKASEEAEAGRRALVAKVGEREGERDRAEAELTEARGRAAERESGVEGARGRLDAATSRLEAARIASAKGEAERRRWEEALGRASAGVKESRALVEALGTESQRVEAEWGEAGAALEAAATALSALEAALAEASGALRGAQEALGEAGERDSKGRVEWAEWSGKARSAEKAVGDWEKRSKENLERLAGLERQREESASKLAGSGVAARDAEGSLKAIDEGRQVAWDRLAQEKQRHGVLRDEAREAEEALRASLSEKEALGRQITEGEQSLQGSQAEIEVLRRTMDERYQVSVPGLLDRVLGTGSLVLEGEAAVKESVTVGSVTIEAVGGLEVTPQDLDDPGFAEELVEKLEGWRGQLGIVGEVNLAALDEYREIEGRYNELIDQRTDLEESVNGIRSAIAKMNRTCRERFRETFDRVNEHFQLAYPKLVGGGSARLALTDEEDLLETGVEIYVQPPGKRLQNLTLLSGGEKAMTAIALLLALFKVKPSPFCVLDEVDAPLDEANGARFNDMLREMSAVSQFVVITHNRKTMECADTLYGVTMPAPGVSRLVTVKLGA